METHASNSNDRKPLMIFAAGRSGSTVVFHVIAEYLKQTVGTEIVAINEFFNPGLCENFSKIEVKDRLRILKKNPKGYFFKLMVSQIYNEHQLSWLSSSYDWVFVERRNLFEQYLFLSRRISTICRRASIYRRVVFVATSSIEAKP